MIVDAPILDGVFQPVADRLALVGHSNFNVARFFTDGATVLLVGTVLFMVNDLHVHGMSWGKSFSSVGMLFPLVVMMMAYSRLQIAHLERMTKPGMMNIGRRTMMPSRVVGLFLLIDHMWILCRDSSWVAMFDFAGYGCWMISCYFASCTSRPPTAQRSSWLRFAFGV